MLLSRGALRRGAVVFAARQRQRRLSGLPEQAPETYSEPANPYHGMEITFLGTGSKVCPRGNASALALRLRSHNLSQLWLFDAGEGALSQLQRSHLRVSQLRNVFITHMHPDHVFGLPGIIMTALSVRAGLIRDKEARLRDPAPNLPYLTVYGPPGIQSFLRASLGTTLPVFREENLLKIVELALPKDGPSSAKRYMARSYWNQRMRKLPFETASSPLLHRIDEKTGNLTYDVLSAQRLDPQNEESVCGIGLVDETSPNDSQQSLLWPAKVQAGLISHSVPSIAYVISEDTSGFRFDKSKLEALGVPTDGRREANEVFQRLLDGNSAEFNGGTIHPSDVSREARAPRRICICGDTSDASGIEHLAKDVDVLVHEATLRAADTRIAKKRGHSSSSSAAEFAKRLGAKRLILNHISVSYDGHEVRGLEAEARRVLGVDRAFVAHDLSVFNVPRHDKPDPFRTFLGFPRCSSPVRNADNSAADSSELQRDAFSAVEQAEESGSDPIPAEAVDPIIEASREDGQPRQALLLREHPPAWMRSSADSLSSNARSKVVHVELRARNRQLARSKRVALLEKDLATPLHAFSKRRRSFAAV